MSINDTARKNIKKYRKIKKMSQREFAEALDVTHSSVSAWEIGKNAIDLNRLSQICDILEVPLCQMIFEDGEASHMEIGEDEQIIIENLNKRNEVKEILKLSLESRYSDIQIAIRLLEELKKR